MNKGMKTWGVAAGCIVMASGLWSTGAFAADANTGFVARYNQNMQVEAGLLKQAQAENGAGVTVGALSATVQNINAQSAALFTSEQALMTAEANIPKRTVSADRKAALIKERDHLEAMIAVGNKEMRREHTKKWRYKEELQIRVWRSQLQTVELQMREIFIPSESWNAHPYANGLTELKSAIFDLQNSAIHYTREWIALAKTPVLPTPASISSLAFANATITIPAAGSVAATDAVATQPVVKDQNGNILADSGTYSLSGPIGATGIAINGATGLVTVNPGATPGVYTVTYTQANLAESVSLTVS